MVSIEQKYKEFLNKEINQLNLIEKFDEIDKTNEYDPIEIANMCLTVMNYLDVNQKLTPEICNSLSFAIAVLKGETKIHIEFIKIQLFHLFYLIEKYLQGNKIDFYV